MSDTSFSTRLKHAWNAFTSREPPANNTYNVATSSYDLSRRRSSFASERTMVYSIYNRIAIDVASITIEHVQLDANRRFESKLDSGLNSVFNLEANTDQSGRSFVQDIVMSMLDEGVVGVVPVDTEISPNSKDYGAFNILSMRTAKIIGWSPQHVRLSVYNDKTGNRQEITMPKSQVAIIENPLYAVMNEPNSTLKRLTRKLSLLDDIDEQSGAGKLDLIIQLPYLVRSEAKRAQAEQRRKDIENQLSGSKYGIAYTDGTEHVTQLNRSVDNNLMKQIEYLTSMLYGQLGITEEIINGTANEQVMLNYYNRTVEPIISAITDEIKRKFISKKAREEGQSIMFFRDPFRLTTVNSIAEIADKFTRNEVMSSNEVRQAIGMKPVDDPKADMLVNSNITQPQDYGYTDTQGPYGEGMADEEDYGEQEDGAPADFMLTPISEVMEMN
nr:MAG TPA: portal protein [Bacteriophage sp.]